jgi:hypothetical protein
VTPAFDPPALPLVALGVIALLAWLVLSPPSRSSPVSALLQGLAAAVLALALVNAGWRARGGERPRLAVLLDRSESMSAVGAGDATRLEESRAWLDGEEFSRLTAGWRVELDSFGGRTTDLAAAIEASSASLPAAILVVSDGRSTAGGGSGAPPVPVFARIPGPVTVPDAAVLDLRIEEDDERARVAVEVAAAGGRGVAARTLAVLVDGREVARARLPALAAGERREVRVRLPQAASTEVVVEARLTEPADAVAANDSRSRVWRASRESRTLLVGLAPGWELGFVHRALAASAAAPLDAYWGATEGTLRGVDGGQSGSWAELDPARYEALWLIGDPALLGQAGGRWVERFAALGGRGIYWGPGGSGGELAGLRAPGAGDAPPVPPALTAAGRRWLESVVGPLAAAPDGSTAWPPLEGLPSARPTLPGGAAVLLQAGGTPVAWSLERGRNRHVVALGTGWYRLALDGGAGRDAPSRRFWRAWTEGAARWLSAASADEAALVTMPEAGRVGAGERLEVRRVDTAEPLAWRIVAAGGAEAASGVSEAGAASIAVGPFRPGAWKLELDAGARRESRAFAVETWSPDLARTEADTGALAATARASGGAVVDGGERLPRAEAAGTSASGPVVSLGRAPWAFLLASLLLLLHWAVAARAR